jgi:hypothetical protein
MLEERDVKYCTNANDAMHIFVVVHESFENTNAFFTRETDAKLYLQKMAKEYKTDECAWKIVMLTESVPFTADIFNPG